MTSRRPVIVLDPGHGGSQPAGGSSPNNARGPNGLLEKDLTLDLARRAAGLLAADAEVFLTRTGDANLPLADRAQAARDRRADVFLSIHMNGFQDPATDGTEVWTARSPSPASRELARLVLQRLLAVTGVADRGVREKNLGVLLPSRHAANTAASLAEVAFLTNPAHARRLEDDGYRQRIAAAIAEGIRQALRVGNATGQGLASPSPAARPSLPARETPPATDMPETSVYQGRAFTPSSSPAIFRCAPTPVAVAPATQLPAATTTPDPAIRDALRAAGLSATDVGSFERAGGLPPLRAFAEVLGGAALGEVMRRLRYTPNRFLSPPHTWGAALARSLGVTHAAEILPGRLLLAIPGHFRELARSAPDEREAHALESLGWLLMESIAGRVATATGKRWWTPAPPPFATPFSTTLPQLGPQIHRLVMRSMLIDSTLTLQDFLARFNTWSQGPAGRQWRLETGRDTAGGTPGRPFYPQVVQIPAAVDTAAQRGQIDQAWQQWVQEAETRHGRGTRQATDLLRDCHNERISGLSLIRSASLGGLELATSFPRFEPAAGSRSGIATSLSVLGVLQPVFELLFHTLHQLGWNDLLFQTAGAACFRGNKVGGDLARQSAAARNISNHGYGSAVDVQVFENPQGQAASTIDPRIVAIFEAFLFRWGRCFAAPSSPDPHHFEYCGRACVPATGGGQSLAADIGGFGAETLGTVAP